MACVFIQGGPGGEGEGEAAGGLGAPAEPPAHMIAAFEGAPLVRTL